jgi:hypothetical protein
MGNCITSEVYSLNKIGHVRGSQWGIAYNELSFRLETFIGMMISSRITKRGRCRGNA